MSAIKLPCNDPRRYPPSNTGKSEKSSFTNVGMNGTLNDKSINTVLIAPKTPTRTIFLADVLFDFFTFVLMVRPPS